jgi:hypothetical protein
MMEGKKVECKIRRNKKNKDYIEAEDWQEQK